MKKLYVLLATLMLLKCFSSSASTADEQAGTLFNQSKWFELKKEFPKIESSMEYDFLKLMSKSLLGYYFNRPEDVRNNINALLSKHQNEIGVANSLNMVLLLAKCEGEQGNYNTATDITKSLLAQSANMDSSTINGITAIYNHYNDFRNTPAPSIEMDSSKDAIIPMEITKVTLPIEIEPKGWRGHQILVPVTIKNKSYKFIFDTGASTSAMSEKLAKETGVIIKNDSILINSFHKNAKFGKMGILEEMQIGDIKFRNSIMCILPENKMNSVMKIDAILGMDFIRLIKEIQILPKDKIIRIPTKTTPIPKEGSNMLIDDNSLIVRTYINDIATDLLFDTGCATAGLNYVYYNENKSRIDSIGIKVKQTGGGFNTIETNEVIKIPKQALKIGNKTLDLYDLGVETEKSYFIKENTKGIIGMDIIANYDCVTINLKDMFISIN